MKTRLTFWRKRIEVAEKRGHFGIKDGERASGWRSCAVGEGLGTIDRPPPDAGLADLGEDFTGSVLSDDIRAARKTLVKIENRLKKLKAKGWKPKP